MTMKHAPGRSPARGSAILVMLGSHHYTHLVQQHCSVLILHEFSILVQFSASLKKSTEINYLVTCV